jgi:uncharacterized protein (TIGR03083 family)
MIPSDTLNKLEHSFRAVAALGAQLSSEQWKVATECPGWSVQDNLSHIIGTERLLQGLERTTHRAADLSVAKNPMGEANEHEVDSRRHRSGAEVLAEWNELLELRVRTLRGADESYFTAEAMTPTGPGTVADFLHIRVMDVWVHEQDMRRALGMPGDDSSPSAEHSIDRLLRGVSMVVGKRAKAPDGSDVVLVLSGPVARRVAVSVRDGRAAVADTVPPEATATITMDSNTYLRLATGRCDVDAVRGSVATSGDVDLAERVLLGLNIMI